MYWCSMRKVVLSASIHSLLVTLVLLANPVGSCAGSSSATCDGGQSNCLYQQPDYYNDLTRRFDSLCDLSLILKTGCYAEMNLFCQVREAMKFHKDRVEAKLLHPAAQNQKNEDPAGVRTTVRTPTVDWKSICLAYRTPSSVEVTALNKKDLDDDYPNTSDQLVSACSAGTIVLAIKGFESSVQYLRKHELCRWEYSALLEYWYNVGVALMEIVDIDDVPVERHFSRYAAMTLRKPGLSLRTDRQRQILRSDRERI